MFLILFGRKIKTCKQSFSEKKSSYLYPQVAKTTFCVLFNKSVVYSSLKLVYNSDVYFSTFLCMIHYFWCMIPFSPQRSHVLCASSIGQPKTMSLSFSLSLFYIFGIIRVVFSLSWALGQRSTLSESSASATGAADFFDSAKARLCDGRLFSCQQPQHQQQQQQRA